MYVYVHAYICVFVCECIGACVHVYMCTCVCVCVYVYDMIISIIYLNLLLHISMTYFIYAHNGIFSNAYSNATNRHFLHMIFHTNSFSYFNDFLLGIILTITRVWYGFLLSIFLTVAWTCQFSYFVLHHHLILTLFILSSFILSRLPHPSYRNHPLTWAPFQRDLECYTPTRLSMSSVWNAQHGQEHDEFNNNIPHC